MQALSTFNGRLPPENWYKLNDETVAFNQKRRVGVGDVKILEVNLWLLL